ncbi:hypothetical protein SODALDRAFT_11430 [Sodiomyces alkalinus F11]|uniref:DUF7492 domain-containing protein n=1 Tax=Sodiomyces alkalinus (strain CBS 110278 / VKM F-3762 / F11) TaxID=1314773 RepID=A0A3N2Q6D3_SODAK|nr:hypothetical protein SODALDRAFT_11430 [Sodiomyces alkalinus F11]ROT42267.1 hypothetical protein SODALDRAFT_11430 [Sodiomyces alkalinus F11]
MKINTIAKKPLASLLIALVAGGPNLAAGHSWLEQVSRVAPNGTIVLPNGYPMGWGGRDGPGFNDLLYSNLIPTDTTKICKRNPLGVQKEGYPALTAAPGDFVALRYLENGHVSKPRINGPKISGIVYVYGTLEPRADDDITDVHKKWTADGTGGDGRGRLLATRHYDDGQCYEANSEEISQTRQNLFPKPSDNFMGPNLWCQTDIQIPSDIPQGSQYVLYWVWSWPQLFPNAIEGSENGWDGEFPRNLHVPNGEYLQSDAVEVAEMYSSCATINVEGEPLSDGIDIDTNHGQSLSAWIQSHFAEHRDYTNAAIRKQLLDQFFVDVGDSQRSPGTGTTPLPTSGQGENRPPVPTTTTGGGIRTVTVTADPTTVYATATVTARPGDNSGPPVAEVQDAPHQGGRPSVEPFMTRRNLRGRSSWNFGSAD